MTITEFIQALAELRWKQADFCAKAGVHKNTVTRWVKGVTPIPDWVPAFLGAMLALKQLHDTYVAVS